MQQTANRDVGDTGLTQVLAGELPLAQPGRVNLSRGPRRPLPVPVHHLSRVVTFLFANLKLLKQPAAAQTETLNYESSDIMMALRHGAP
jgi:hypothetical protein